MLKKMRRRSWHPQWVFETGAYTATRFVSVANECSPKCAGAICHSCDLVVCGPDTGLRTVSVRVEQSTIGLPQTVTQMRIVKVADR